ncbi:MAG: pyridoxal phosphate-dependent aminotransferase, partial [Gammaproteobacteria bacterium]|nr:pyridoxal phosphate-dependent aminotransferase [Gammaproteobacteria bacterium]
TDPTYVGLINRVRLAGGVPRYLPLRPGADGWRLDLDSLQELDRESIAAALLMSPAMPTGAVFTEDDWRALSDFCHDADCWLIDNTAMERILFDGRQVVHPASFADMRTRVISVGSASKEYRMIGWRVGWVVGPADIVADVARVSISNVVCQTGIAMGGVAAAINEPNDGVAASAAELQRRRDLILAELAEFKVVPPHGGWSMLVDVSELGMDGPTASKLLLEKGKIAATAMINWGGEHCANYVRLVYSNEPVERLEGIGSRFRSALL